MEKEIEDIMSLLDGHVEAEKSRLTLKMSDELNEGEIQEKYHHGRCDVGSPWALGTVKNENV